MESIKYVGLDVHAEKIAVAVGDERREAAVEFRGTITNGVAAIRKLMRTLGSPDRLRVCYEAGPCGYEIYWQLVEMGIACDVVAPTLIPTKAGDRVKTDRRDAIGLATCHRAGTLTAVWVPDKAHEALRDLVRARGAAKCDERKARHRLDKFLLRHGRRRPQKTKAWGTIHSQWLDNQTFSLSALQTTFEDYWSEVTHATERVKRLDSAIDQALLIMPEQTQRIVAGLQALRGVAKTTAIAVVAEVGRFSRFDNPAQLMAYSGSVPKEYTSGNTRRKGGITKAGNSHLRRLLVESAWSYRHRPLVRGDLKHRQQLADRKSCEIANKAQRRLCQRYRTLLASGKPSQKVVTAVGRELLGFMWDISCHIEREHQPEHHAVPVKCRLTTTKRMAD